MLKRDFQTEISRRKRARMPKDSPESFRNDIASQSWDDLLMFEDPNDMWLAWKTLFLSVVDKHAPIRMKRVRSSERPWVTPQLKKYMYERDKLKKKATITNDPFDWTNFKNFRNQVNNKIKNAKEMYYKSAFKHSSRSSRKTWHTISYRDFLSGTDKRFEPQPIDNNRVRFLLSKLCTSKATRLDKISARLLRECSDLTSYSLCEIFNLSIITGVSRRVEVF